MARSLDDQRQQQDLKLSLIEQALATSAAHATTGTEAPETAAEAFTPAAATTSATARKAALEIVTVTAERAAFHAETAATAHAARTETTTTEFAAHFRAKSFATLKPPTSATLVTAASAAPSMTMSATFAALVMDVHHFHLSVCLHDGHKIYLKTNFARG
ncbi:hypothetical protein [Novosphingobium sp. BL-8A]|uniref:hypothetical protein n=1 Tax=Novosphingobium sp. BL-8A TaxID=3127639 RepID=UPI003757FBAC